MQNWVWINDIRGRKMDNGGLRIQNWGWRAFDWGWTIHIWGFHHATPTLKQHFFCHSLSRILLFEGHYKALQLFPGLVLVSPLFQLIRVNMYQPTRLLAGYKSDLRGKYTHANTLSGDLFIQVIILHLMCYCAINQYL